MQGGADVRQHLLAQQHKGLFGAACGDIRAVDVLFFKEPLADRPGGGAGVAEEVGARQGEPIFQCCRIKARADGGVEQHFACAQPGELLTAQQQHVLVQAGEHHFALGQQLGQRLVGHAGSFGVRLAAAAVIADIRTHELQRIGDHPAGHAQAHDAHLQSGDLHRLVPQHGHPEAVQQAGQLVQHILHHAAVAVIPDAQHLDAPGAGVGDVYIGAFLGVKAAAHADVADVRAALNDALAHAGGVAQQHRVGVPDAADDLVLVGGDVGVAEFP